MAIRNLLSAFKGVLATFPKLPTSSPTPIRVGGPASTDIIVNVNFANNPIDNANASVSSVTPAILPSGNFSFVKPIEPVGVKILTGNTQYLRDDVVSIGDTHLTNLGYEKISPNGISSLRPEMIAVTNFNPIFKYTLLDNESITNLTPHGTLIDVLNKAIQLRQDNLAINIGNMTSTLNEANNVFGQISQDFDQKLNQITKYVTYAKTIHESMDQIKNYLDFHDELKSYMIQYSANKFSLQASTNSTASSMTTRMFIDRYMKFKNSDVDNFTNTKLYLQILMDLKESLQTYSLELYEDTDSDREQFLDPFSIDTTYGSSAKDSRFSLKKWIPRDGTVLDATRQVNFNSFYGMMPTQPESRIKILITALSKEYRISKGLGNANISKKLLDNFNASNIGNPFDNIFGSAGNSIFENISGPKSLASLARVVDDNDSSVIVFPFENLYIDKENNSSQNKTYIPGSSYFVDSMVDFSSEKTGATNIQSSQNNLVFNTTTITKFSNAALGKLIAADDVVKGLLDVNNSNGTSVLNPTAMFRKVLQAMTVSTLGLTFENSASPDQAAVGALFKYAYSDPTLKMMLFQFVILCGISNNKISQDRKIFSDLIKEIPNTNGLSYIPTQGGGTGYNFATDDYSYAIAQTAALIEKYVINSLYKNAGGKNEIGGPVILPSGAQPAFSYSTTGGKILGPTGVVSIGLDNLTGVLIQSGDLTTILTNIGIAPLNGRYTNLIYEFVALADRFYDDASESNQYNFLTTTSGVSVPQTRFNLLTPSGQMLILYEIFLSACQQYVLTDFSVDNNYTNNTLLVYVNNEIQKIINDTYLNYIGNAKEVSSFELRQLDTRIIDTFRNPTPTSAATGSPGDGISGLTQSFTFISQTGTWVPNAQIYLLNKAGKNVWEVDTNNKIRALTNSNIAPSSMDLLTKLYGGYLKIGVYQQTESSLISDYKAIEGMLSMLSLIKQNFSSIVQVVGGTFGGIAAWNPSLFGGASGASLLGEVLTFYKGYTGEYSFFKNRAQVQIAVRTLDRFKSQLNNAPKISNTNIDDALRPLFAGFTPTSKETKLLHKFMSQNKFLDSNLASDRTKIISVGVPMGFSKNISERMKRDKQNNFHGNVNADIVIINVYKRDYRYDEIVFKPKKYLFDLSLYQNDSEFNEFSDLDSVTYEACKSGNLLFDYGELSNNQAKDYTYQTIAQNSERYRLIDDNKRKQIFTNHLESYLLERYINYTTGLNINETAFYSVNAGSAMSVIDKITNVPNSVRQRFREMVYKYISLTMNVSGLAGRGFEEIILDSNVPKEVKDFLSLISFSYSLNPNYIFNKTLIPKTFERVFHIAVSSEDSDPYYIDYNKTTRTMTGKLSLDSLALNNKIVTKSTGEKFISTQGSKEAVFSDYFITIEGSDIIV